MSHTEVRGVYTPRHPPLYRWCARDVGHGQADGMPRGHVLSHTCRAGGLRELLGRDLGEATTRCMFEAVRKSSCVEGGTMDHMGHYGDPMRRNAEEVN